MKYRLPTRMRMRAAATVCAMVSLFAGEIWMSEARAWWRLANKEETKT